VTEETAAFANARIFDGVSAELREGCVRVAAGTIAGVAEGPEPGDRIVDCRGRTVIPGLIDAHFHAYGARLSLLEIETSPLSYLALAGARRLADALGRGFTTVRDPGGGDAGLARAVREGLTAAPRYLFCGPALSQTGGHGDPRPPELGCCLGGGHMAEVVDGVDALRRAARERLRSGAHAIKIMASGGVALLRAATSVNAELLGRDELGRIGPGAVADLLVLDADPLRDPSVLWGDPNRRAVFQGGTRVAEQGARLECW
jgi:imidazolonepropionase-like amidohydrolase